MTSANTPIQTAAEADPLASFGPGAGGTVSGLHQFAWIPPDKLDRLARAVLQEDWGKNHWVLKLYLAVHVWLAVKQQAYVREDDTLVMCAGHLQSRYGVPVYLSFEPNQRSGAAQPWYLQYIGDRPDVSELPKALQLPTWPSLTQGAEIVIAHEHILSDHSERVAFLSKTPPVAQMCALAGAIQWSLFRGLAIPQVYRGTPTHFVPLYLQNREDITAAPDLVAPIQTQGDRLLVRTAFPPHYAYARARCAVERHDQLPHWLVEAWRNRPDEAVQTGDERDASGENE